MTPIVSMISAPLKIGKLNMRMSMKSLTPHKAILSIRFPAVPAMRNAAVVRLIFLIIYSRINTPIPIALIAMMMRNGNGNDREIPVLNVGRMNAVSSIYLRS